jgi:hypothetical protein
MGVYILRYFCRACLAKKDLVDLGARPSGWQVDRSGDSQGRPPRAPALAMHCALCWTAPALPLSPDPQPPPRICRAPLRRPRASRLPRVSTPRANAAASPNDVDDRDDGAADPPFIPQTIEYALRCAQSATVAALVAGDTRLVVTLPMGRSRRHWYRLSPLDGELVRRESALLTLHFAEIFNGARLRVVLGVDAEFGRDIPWMERCDVIGRAEGEGEVGDDAPQYDAVVFGGLAVGQRAAFERELARMSSDTAVIMFNCFVEVPVGSVEGLAGFRPAYVCRSSNKTAILFVGYGQEADGWHVYAETAIFEFEWVGRRAADGWEPTPREVERVLQARGCKRRSIGGYWESVSRGCESGFWPFMTIASREVLPIPGSQFQDRAKGKASKGNSKPFGFF